MTLATPTIRVYFGSTAGPGNSFVLNDTVRGVLDGTTYTLGGDTGTLVDSDAFDLRVRRGRSRETDEFQAGTCEVSLYNWTRTYDDTNVASPWFGEVTVGKRVVVTVWSQIIFDGTIEEWHNDWNPQLDPMVTFTAVDGLGQLALRQFDDWTTTAGQVASDRLTDSLNRSEVNYPISRNFDTGISTLQADTVSWGSNVLNYLQLVAKSDAGRIFVSRDGTLTFLDRRSLVNPTSAVTFNDTGTGIPFHGVTTDNGAELLFNRVGVDRVGGTLQTAEDTTSETNIGIRQLNLSQLLMDSDPQAADMAAWLLNLYKDPVTRIGTVTVNCSVLDNAAHPPLVAALDIGDVINVSWTPQRTGAALSQLLVVDGIDHAVSASGVHVMSLATSLAQQVGMFVLDDTTYGQLDTGGRLAF